MTPVRTTIAASALAVILLGQVIPSQDRDRLAGCLTANEIWRLLWHWPEFEHSERGMIAWDRATHEMARAFAFARNPDAEGDLSHWNTNLWFWQFRVHGRMNKQKLDTYTKERHPEYGSKVPFYVGCEDAFFLDDPGDHDSRYPSAALPRWSITYLTAPDLHENLPRTWDERKHGTGVTFPRIVRWPDRPPEAEYLVVAAEQRMYMICLFDRDQEFVIPRGKDEPRRFAVRRRAGALLLLMDRTPLQVVRTGPNPAWRRDLASQPEIANWLDYQAEGVALTAETLLEGIARSAGIRRRMREPEQDTPLLGSWVLRRIDGGWQVAGNGEQHAIPERELLVLPCDRARGEKPAAFGAETFVVGRFGDFVIAIDGASSTAVQVDLR
jgi:hypothetical protein